MGGIAFEISESEFEKFFTSKSKEIWFIGDRGIDDLMVTEDGRKILPDLSEEEIKSKSKANGLTKALVCTQALWFIAQCLTRCKWLTYFHIRCAGVEKANLISASSRTTDSHKLVGAQHTWSCCLCAIDIPSLVGEAFRSGLPYNDSRSNPIGVARFRSNEFLSYVLRFSIDC